MQPEDYVPRHVRIDINVVLSPVASAHMQSLETLLNMCDALLQV